MASHMSKLCENKIKRGQNARAEALSRIVLNRLMKVIHYEESM